MRNRFILSITAVDLVLLLVSLLFATQLVWGVWFPWTRAGNQVLSMLGFVGGGALLASLATAGWSRPGVPRPTFGRGLAIVGETIVITAVCLVFSRYYFSRSLLVWTFVIWTLLVTLHRVWRRLRPWTERIAAVSNEQDLLEQLAEAPHVELVAVIDPDTVGEIELLQPGTTIAVDFRTVSKRVAQYVTSCAIAGYPVRPMASVYEEHTGRIPLVHLAEGWEIQSSLDRSRFLFGKRLFDLVTVAVTSPVWMLLGAVVGLVIRRLSPGPVIFAQRRVGRDGRPFVMYKFRTMELDAESRGPQFTSQSDSRLIRGGSWLRRSRLDEIPQLWNVLKGEMSLVGPRAEQEFFVQEFSGQIPFYPLRHEVRPGITGWAQVNYGYADDLADTVEKLTHDLFYIRHMSPILDMEILWKSVWTVLTGAGAR